MQTLKLTQNTKLLEQKELSEVSGYKNILAFRYINQLKRKLTQFHLQ